MQVGAAIVASRFAVAEVPPFTLAMLRYAIGFACLLPFALAGLPAWRHARPLHSRTADLAAMAGLGILQFGVLIALLNFGLRAVPAGEAALVFSLFPLLTLALSAALGRERVTASLVGGVLASFAGVALALSPRLGSPAGASWLHEGAIAASAAVGAACSVAYRPYLQRYPVVPVSALAMLSSVLFLALAGVSEDWPHRIGQFSTGAWGATAFIGISSGVGYFWWLYALAHEPPTRVTVFLALNPPTAALLGWALLGEPLHASLGGALVMVATGLWLATRPTGK